MNDHERDYDAEEREVSALYRGLGREEPPPALDEAILRAAREEAGGRKSGYAGRAGLSIAASVMVVSVSMLLFGDLGERARDDDEAVATFAPAPAADGIQVQGASAEQARLEDSTAEGLAPGPLVEPTRDRVLDSELRRTVILRSPEGRVVEELRREIPETATAATDRPPPEARSNSTGASSVPERLIGVDGEDSSSSQQAASVQELLQLVEEARLTETQEARETPDGRQEAWLAEIQELLEEERLVEANNELELFRNAYPDVDVDAVLTLPPSLRE